jgi:hypothetical protein
MTGPGFRPGKLFQIHAKPFQIRDPFLQTFPNNFFGRFVGIQRLIGQKRKFRSSSKLFTPTARQDGACRRADAAAQRWACRQHSTTFSFSETKS